MPKLIRRLLAPAFAAGLMLAAPAAHAACQMIINSEVDVRFNGNRPLVETTFNGKPAWMEIDTGAAFSLIFAGPAEQLGLKGYDTGRYVAGVGGESALYRAKVAEFGFGKTKVKDFEINIGGGVNMRGVVRGDERRVVGLLGRDFFGLTDAVELDFAAGKLRMLTFRDCANRSWAYWSPDAPFITMGRANYRQAPFVFPLKLNGFTVYSMLDSGAGVSVVTPQIASRAGINPDSLPVVGYSSGIGARKVATRVGTFDTVELGEEKVNKAQISISELFREDTTPGVGSKVGENGTPMLLGADFLHAHRVLIASAQDRIYFTYNGGPIFHKVTSDRPQPLPQPAEAPKP